MKIVWALLIIIILLCLTQAKGAYVKAIQNAGMVPLLRVVTSEHDKLSAAEQAALLLQQALAQGTAQPRAAAIKQWLKHYQARAAAAQENRTQLKAIQTAWESDVLSFGAEQQLLAQATERRWIERDLVLTHVYQQRGDNANLRRSLEGLQKWHPEYSNAAPTEWQGWRLEGYDLRPLSATCRADTYIVLYWRNSAQEYDTNSFVLHPDQGLYRVGNRLFQVLRARNLLANGEFECPQFDELTAKPTGYQLMFQNKDPGTATYQVAPHGEAGQSHYLHVTNAQGAAILFQEPVWAQATSAYLQLAQLRGSGNGFVGAREFVGGANRFSLLAQDVTEADWQGYAGIFEPDAGAMGIYAYLGVREGLPSWADFDNLGLYPITPGFALLLPPQS